MTTGDEIVVIGNRIYVKATARLETSDGRVFVNSAFAREPESKKGMDESQVTGMASSYARKYALNGLFCIDDTRDADTMNNSEAPKTSTKKKAEPAPAPTPEAKAEDDKLYLVKQLITECKTKDDLLKLWEEWPELHEQIKPLFSAKRKELNF